MISIIDLNRPIAERIAKEVTGRQFHELDASLDKDLVFAVFRKANIVRMLREKIDLTWIPADELRECRRLKDL